jgi:tRNA A-37 threonylcarbamoyl transferase component Bud32
VRLLAAGRDCDVLDAGDGTVVRRHRRGRSQVGEAEVMAHARAHGFPCPRVHRVDGADLVLDLVAGPTLLDDLLADPSPARCRRVGSVLADLHRQLHRIPPLPGVPGAALLHLDLHPANVLLGPDGPVLVDWTNASGGMPATDVAMTWVILGLFAGTAPDVVGPMIDASSTARTATPPAPSSRRSLP